MNLIHWDDEEKGESGSFWHCEPCNYDEDVSHYPGFVYGLPAEIFTTTPAPIEEEPCGSTSGTS